MYEYFDDMYGYVPDESLSHHGIKGQKWGIRRFQNYDGTLKKAGKDRIKTDKEEKKAAKKTAKEEKKEAKALKEHEKERAEIEKAIANVDIAKIAELKGKMTTDDLKAASQRAQALGQVSENLGKYKSQLPKSTGEKVLSALGAVKTGVDAVKGVHKSVRELREELGLDTKSILENYKSDSNQNGEKGGKKDDAKKGTFSAVDALFDKVNKKYQEKKFTKDLASEANKKKNADTLDWLKKISGSDKPAPKPKANFEPSFKLKDGDYSIFKSTLPSSSAPSASKKSGASIVGPIVSKHGSTSSKSISIPKSTSSWISSNTSPKSSIGGVSINFLNDRSDAAGLLKKNSNSLGL